MSNDATLQTLKALLGSGVVSYQVVFAKSLGSATAAIWLSQGYFWQEKAEYKDLVSIGGKDYFQKTAKQWFEHTGLTDEQQKTARNTLTKAGILTEKLCGTPAKLYYRVELDAIVSVINKYLLTGKPVSVKNGNKFPQTTETTIGNLPDQVSANHGNYYIGRELKESLESNGERENAQKRELAPAAPAENQKIAPSLEAEKKEKNIVPAGTPTAPRPWRSDFNEEEAYEQIKNDTMFRDAFSMSAKVPPQHFETYLAIFMVEQKASLKKHESLTDLRKHILNWSRIRWKNEKAERQQSNNGYTSPEPKKEQIPLFSK